LYFIIQASGFCGHYKCGWKGVSNGVKNQRLKSKMAGKKGKIQLLILFFHLITLNPFCHPEGALRLCHSEGAKRLKNLGEILRCAQNDSGALRMTVGRSE
jgi:hypothetical protein